MPAMSKQADLFSPTATNPRLCLATTTRSPPPTRLHHSAIPQTPPDQRGGIYKLPMPRTLGNEAAGTIAAVGSGTEFKVGDKVAVSGVPLSFTRVATERGRR